VPVLLIVSVKSDVFPISTVPKARLPLSETTLVDAEVEGEVGVGAAGLLFPQAAAARAPRSATRQSERTRGSNTILRESPTRVTPGCANSPVIIFRLCNRGAIDLESQTAFGARIGRIISGSVGPSELMDFEFGHSRPIL
jgi:hypothetical protein